MRWVMASLIGILAFFATLVASFHFASSGDLKCALADEIEAIDPGQHCPSFFPVVLVDSRDASGLALMTYSQEVEKARARFNDPTFLLPENTEPCQESIRRCGMFPSEGDPGSSKSRILRPEISVQPLEPGRQEVELWYSTDQAPLAYVKYEATADGFRPLARSGISSASGFLLCMAYVPICIGRALCVSFVVIVLYLRFFR